MADTTSTIDHGAATDYLLSSHSTHVHVFPPSLQPNPDLFQRCSLTRSLHYWIQILHDVDDDASFLLDGIAHGFRLVSDISTVTSCDSKNYRSAIDVTTKPRLDKLFLEELQLQRFTRVDDKPHRIQAIGAVPKKDSSTPRPITDCSRPLHDSLNSYLTPEPFTFDSIDDVVCLS